MKLIKITAALLGFILSASSYAGFKTIDVFHASKDLKRHEIIDGVHVNYYYLPALKEMDSSLSERLPNNERDAQLYINNFFNSEEGKEWIKKTEHYAKGISKVFGYKVESYPAVVFDGEFVVYGTNNVKEAINAYLN
ncbi:DUF1525 domain-containing protein [Vibrio europaeus]|uniref:DUF1525 domain-containing protein n=1 Tax=Vibrio europaeus TaxID=300876 RepID=UPI00233F1F8F|nr:DUF1525 domain-containing protein [Vibrio europaeus]MDC5870263.1 DUF1525 domain-containing protein [Vibrio europaeus]